MNKTILLCFILVCVFRDLFSQLPVKFFPDDSQIQFFKSQEKEPRFGILYYPSNENMKFDIGLPINILKFQINEHSYLTSGLQTSIRILSKNYSEKRFQIDGMDGTLGGFVTYTMNENKNQHIFRLRINHVSSHLVDGHWNSSTNNWISRHPLPYTQDYFEFAYLKNINQVHGLIRYMSSIGYSVFVRPSEIKRLIFNGSFEYYFKFFSTEILELKFTPLISYNLELNGNTNYKVNHSLFGGLKLGELLGKGIIFYVSYYSGNNFFYQYYNESFHNSGFGFLIDY